VSYKIRTLILRITPFIALALCIACGSSGNNAGNTDEGETLISNDAPTNIDEGETPDGNDAAINTNEGETSVSNNATNSQNESERELVVSEKTKVMTVAQCFCITLHRSTLQFYHFEENNAVLLIEFDNQTRDFNRTVNLHLFEDTATTDSIAKWINNQHSDGIYDDAAVPMVTHNLPPDSVSITSTAFVERLVGELGDEYEKTRIDFTVSNSSEPGSYFLNGFADQSDVYFQTKPISSDTSSNSLTGDERELVVTEKTKVTTVTQCFCATLHRSTLLFYHFEEDNAVLLIEFDNQTRDFDRTVSLHLFENSATSDSIAKWINNQHSDGIYADAPVPLATHNLPPDSVSIELSTLVEIIEGEQGDEYEKTHIEFSVSNSSEPGSYVLGEFGGHSVVYFQTRPIN